MSSVCQGVPRLNWLNLLNPRALKNGKHGKKEKWVHGTTPPVEIWYILVFKINDSYQASDIC